MTCLLDTLAANFTQQAGELRAHISGRHLLLINEFLEDVERLTPRQRRNCRTSKLSAVITCAGIVRVEA